VIWLPGGRRRGLAAVIGPAGGRDNSTGVLVLTEDRRVRRVAVRDLGGAPVRVGKVAMPRQLSPKSPRFKSYVARALSELDPPSVPRPPAPPPGRRRRPRAGRPPRGAARPPGARLPRPAEHEKWMQRHDQLAKEQRHLSERVRRRTGSLVRTFDRVLEVLGSLGYVDGFALTGKGETLRRVYAETDLVVVEALHRGVWRDLTPPSWPRAWPAWSTRPAGRTGRRPRPRSRPPGPWTRPWTP
jgi:ATP-dependent RNA helicase HelY